MATNKSARSQATLWGAIGLVGIVVVLALVLIVFPGNKDEDAGPAPAPSGDAGCNVPVGDTSSSPKIPDDLDWEAANGWTWPVSPSVGPTEETKDGYGICFAHSPLGAALFLTNVAARLTTPDVDEATELVKLYLADSPGKTKLLADPKGGSPATPARLVGFTVDSYTSTRAQLSLVLGVAESPTGYAATPVTLEWVDGDWKLRPLDNGDFFAGNPSFPAAGDFVAWGATDAGA